MPRNHHNRVGSPRRSEDQQVKPSGSVLLRLVGYLPPLKNRLVLALACMFGATVLDLGYGWFAMHFLDTIQEAQKAGTGFAPAMGSLNFYAGVGILAFAAKGVLAYGQQYFMANVAQRLAMRLRNQIFAHLQGLSLSFFDKRKTGQLMSGITNDVPAIQNSFTGATLRIFSSPLIVIGGIAVMFVLNWKLALVTLLCLPVIARIIAAASQRIKRYTAQLQEDLSEVSQRAEESISGIRVVKAFANEEYEINRFERHSQNVFRSVMRTIRTRAAMLPAIELVGAIGIILVLWVGAREILTVNSTLTIGKLTFFVLVVQKVAEACRGLGTLRTSLSVASAAGERVFSLLDQRSEVVEKPDALELQVPEGRIEFRHVGFAYLGGLPVLQDIDFVMEPGQVVAVVGPTGAGKTTIASLIPRLYEATEGGIHIDGVDIRDVTLASLRRQIGIVPQDAAVFSGAIRENIAYGRLDASFEEIVAAAKTANAHEFIEASPDGYDTIIGERGATLSGGQRQRIAIARAILRDPRILILDEATSSLDARSEALVQDALAKLVASRTTLVIAHRLSTIRDADKILVLKDGCIVENGSHEELIQVNGVYADLYRTQFSPGPELPPAPEETASEIRETEFD